MLGIEVEGRLRPRSRARAGAAEDVRGGARGGRGNAGRGGRSRDAASRALRRRGRARVAAAGPRRAPTTQPRGGGDERGTGRARGRGRQGARCETDGLGEIGLLGSLAIFVLAVLVGFEVIAKVPATLHTPLMSGANSIHGIVLVGAMIIAGIADEPLGYLLAFIGVVFGAMNVVGGYVVTDRMLQMFKKRPTAPPKPPTRRRRPRPCRRNG